MKDAELMRGWEGAGGGGGSSPADGFISQEEAGLLGCQPGVLQTLLLTLNLQLRLGDECEC